MKTINMTKIWQKYKGLWVAMKHNNSRTVVGSGKTLKEAIDEAHNNGYKRPIMSFMHPDLLKPHIGGFFSEV